MRHFKHLDVSKVDKELPTELQLRQKFVMGKVYFDNWTFSFGALSAELNMLSQTLQNFLSLSCLQNELMIIKALLGPPLLFLH